MSLNIELLGVRGSLPTPVHPTVYEDHLREILQTYALTSASRSVSVNSFIEALPQHMRAGYGGNTSCVWVKSPGAHILIDGGSGIRHANPAILAEGGAQGKAEVHILLTHFHWDHIMGLPFFSPLFIKGNKVHFYAVQDDLLDMLKSLFKKPYFPVPFEVIKDNVVLHKLAPRKPFQLGDMTISPFKLDHPDPCWGFRVESGGRVYAHCVDTEATRVSREDLGPDLPFYQGVNLMLFDAQYSTEEAKEKVNWGHSSAVKGLEIAIRENIGRVIFSHHDPFSTDDKISHTFQVAHEYYEQAMEKLASHGQNSFIHWLIGYEGLKIDV